KRCSKAERTAKSWCRATAERASWLQRWRRLTTRSPCHPSADPVVPVAPVDKAAQAGPAVRAIGLRVDPMAPIPPPADREENVVQAVRATQVDRADLVAVDLDLQRSLSRRNKAD